MSEVLIPAGDPEERSALEEAADWLRDYFGNPALGGADIASNVIRAAAKDGISQRTLQRARKPAGVTTGKGSAGWTWSCDPGQGASA